jgi:hypothetical protein
VRNDQTVSQESVHTYWRVVTLGLRAIATIVIVITINDIAI